MRRAVTWSFFGVAILEPASSWEAPGPMRPSASAGSAPDRWRTVRCSGCPVAGAHLLLINRNKPGTAVTATYLMVGLSFLLVVYSTFLTKSGILGDTWSTASWTAASCPSSSPSCSAVASRSRR